MATIRISQELLCRLPPCCHVPEAVSFMSGVVLELSQFLSATYAYQHAWTVPPDG